MALNRHPVSYAATPAGQYVTFSRKLIRHYNVTITTQINTERRGLANYKITSHQTFDDVGTRSVSPITEHYVLICLGAVRDVIL